MAFSNRGIVGETLRAVGSLTSKFNIIRDDITDGLFSSSFTELQRNRDFQLLSARLRTNSFVAGAEAKVTQQITGWLKNGNLSGDAETELKHALIKQRLLKGIGDNYLRKGFNTDKVTIYRPAYFEDQTLTGFRTENLNYEKGKITISNIKSLSQGTETNVINPKKLKYRPDEILGIVANDRDRVLYNGVSTSSA